MSARSLLPLVFCALAPMWRPNESECIDACDRAREPLMLR